MARNTTDDYRMGFEEGERAGRYEAKEKLAEREAVIDKLVFERDAAVNRAGQLAGVLEEARGLVMRAHIDGNGSVTVHAADLLSLAQQALVLTVAQAQGRP